MTKRDFGSMALKLLGVYAIIEALPLLGQFAFFVGLFKSNVHELSSGFFVYIVQMIPFVLMSAVGVLLLTRSDKFASRLFKEDTKLSVADRPSVEDVQTVVFSAVGLLVLVLAIPQLVMQAINFLLIVRDESTLPQNRALIMRSLQTNLIGFFIQAGLGAYLFFRARGLVNFLKRLQVGRYEKIADAEKRAADEP